MSWLDRWRSGPAPEPRRWVVLDVESTGLDPEHDTLLAVAAVAVHRVGDGHSADGRPALVPHDSFEARLRHAAPEADDARRHNVLLHGIGLGAQRSGDDPAAVLAAFARWAGDAPLFGFHVAFDRRLLQRAGAVLSGPWIDIEALAAVTHPGVARGALDDWLDRFAIPCEPRHDAAADTLATAELLLRLWPRLAAELGPRHLRAGTVGALQKLESARRWVG